MDKELLMKSIKRHTHWMYCEKMAPVSVELRMSVSPNNGVTVDAHEGDLGLLIPMISETDIMEDIAMLGLSKRWGMLPQEEREEKLAFLHALCEGSAAAMDDETVGEIDNNPQLRKMLTK